MIEGGEIRINLKIQESVTPELYEMINRVPRSLRADFIRHKLSVLASALTSPPTVQAQAPMSAELRSGDSLHIVSAIGADFLR